MDGWMDSDILIEIYIYLLCKGKSHLGDEWNVIHCNFQTVLKWISPQQDERLQQVVGSTVDLVEGSK